MEFKVTKGKRPQGWGVYFSREIITGELDEITIMPRGNSNSNEQIAICWDKRKVGRNGGLTLEEAKHNAQLISKAPELLEMLKEFVQANNGKEDISENLFEKANMLIKEATTL